MKKKYFTEEERKLARCADNKKWYNKIKDDRKRDRIIYKLENKDKLDHKRIEKAIKSKERKEANRKEYLERNKDKIKIQRKERYLKTKEHYIVNNNKRKKEREQTEPLYKLSNNVRRNIRRSFSRNNTVKFRKVLKSEQLLGCSILDFTKYLLSKCPEGTTPSDFHQFGYHLDHIIPIASAKTQEEIEKLCHYTNYQPLWWRDNIIKSNKI